MQSDSALSPDLCSLTFSPAGLARSGDEPAPGTLPADIPRFITEGFGSRACTWQATLSAFACCAARASWCAATAAPPVLLGSGISAPVFTQTKHITPKERPPGSRRFLFSSYTQRSLGTIGGYSLPWCLDTGPALLRRIHWSENSQGLGSPNSCKESPVSPSPTPYLFLAHEDIQR